MRRLKLSYAAYNGFQPHQQVHKPTQRILFTIRYRGFSPTNRCINYRKIAEASIEKQVFQARNGDRFTWHANPMHGGEPHLDKALTRKSMAFHYFRQAHIGYHEITQKTALPG